MECQTPNNDGLIMLRRVIDSDNSCLFNSIGFPMLNSKLEQQKLRKIIREEIESKPGEYEAMLDRPLDDY